MSDVLRVALPRPLPHPFDYLPPDGAAAGPDWIGCRVRAPFGRHELVGVVVETGPPAGDPERLRPVYERLDQAPLTTPELWETLQWAARYYCHPLGEVVATALPAVLRHGQQAEPAGEPWLGLTSAGRVGLAAAKPRRGTRACELAEALLEQDLPLADCRRRWPGAGTPIRRWKVAGWLRETRRLDDTVPELEPPEPSSDQRAAVEAIAAHQGAHAAFLLEGVTGSGKTEVYLELIRRALADGCQALVLVPEIGLTPQTLRRFRAQLACPVLALHSGLSDGERVSAWLAARSGAARLIVGTRSAVFTPLANPGLIVVDEEHDGSYKQQDGFRYSARDLALWRARRLGVPIVLGSATPSLESLHNAERGRFRKLLLPARARDARPPTIKILDARRLRIKDGLSAPLIDAIAAAVARGEQALVFRNRRGYAPLLICHDCGWTPSCGRCDRPLTFHRARNQLCCHHCGAQSTTPASCPECGRAELVPFGTGTERLEAGLQERFPDVPVMRVDSDTARGQQALRSLLDRIPQDEARILVGTQMLAKGHDLPNLTVVAVVGIDEALFSADFRATERVAQLIVQVAGRAGRADKPGVVYLQTHHPAHPLLLRLVHDGYAAFAEDELALRRTLEFPPYAHFALLRAEAKQLTAASAFMQAAARKARELLELAPEQERTVSWHGPVPAPMPRRAGYQRLQLVVQAPARRHLHAFLEHWMAALYALPEARKVRWSLDVDPLDLY